MENEFNYHVNEHTGLMTIYANNDLTVAEISECNNMSKQELNNIADEVLNELGFIDTNYFSV